MCFLFSAQEIVWPLIQGAAAPSKPADCLHSPFVGMTGMTVLVLGAG